MGSSIFLCLINNPIIDLGYKQFLGKTISPKTENPQIFADLGYAEKKSPNNSPQNPQVDVGNHPPKKPTISR